MYERILSNGHRQVESKSDYLFASAIGQCIMLIPLELLDDIRYGSNDTWIVFLRLCLVVIKRGENACAYRMHFN